MTIGERIRQLREERGLSLTQAGMLVSTGLKRSGRYRKERAEWAAACQKVPMSVARNEMYWSNMAMTATLIADHLARCTEMQPTD